MSKFDCTFVLEPDSDRWRCTRCKWQHPLKREKVPRKNCTAMALEREKAKGDPKPGNVLHRLLRDRIGVDTTAKCNCDEKRILMNMWGPSGCRENLEWIVAGLLDEAAKRGWQIDGRRLLTLAAKLGTLTPWGMAHARSWARALVTEAIEICESDKGA